MRDAGLADAALLAALHGESFARPWSVEAFEGFLGEPAISGLVADGGFILWRSVAGEAEIFTLAVIPPMRRRGVARALLERALIRAAEQGGEAMFLEVSDQNAAAVALYRAAGFEVTGRRRGYYETENQPQDALTMRLSLTAR